MPHLAILPPIVTILALALWGCSAPYGVMPPSQPQGLIQRYEWVCFSHPAFCGLGQAASAVRPSHSRVGVPSDVR